MLLVHPGGPFFKNKDLGAWSIPKGEVEPDEDLLSSAKREFREETGIAAEGPFYPLGRVRQAGGKIVHAWAFEGDCDPESLTCNDFEIEWPPRSGKMQRFPEVDRAAFFSLDEAKQKLNPAQAQLLPGLELAIATHDAAK